MGKLEKMKEEYDNIKAPKELNARIQQEIGKSRKRQSGTDGAIRKRNFSKGIRILVTAAAAVCIIFTMLLNTNPVFAKEAAAMPGIGNIARLFTFRSYETEKEGIEISVDIPFVDLPTVEMIAEDTGIVTEELNLKIYQLCEKYAEDAALRAEEYKTAFLETGGTEEEWEAHNIRITVSYEIKQQNDKYLSFIIRGTDNWTNACQDTKYYNLDVETGKTVTLEDLLGSGCRELVNESIREQISERETAGDVFWEEDKGGFTGISENANFYINENNNPVIVFGKYEIAPGSSGEIEFEIADR